MSDQKKKRFRTEPPPPRAFDERPGYELKDIRKQAMIDALRANLGVVSKAAKEVGIERKQHYRWLQQDPEYQEACEDLKETAIDFAESQLFKHMQDSYSACIFYLKCQAKHRGYVERTEIAGPNGQALQVQHNHQMDLTNLSPKQIDELENLIHQAGAAEEEHQQLPSGPSQEGQPD